MIVPEKAPPASVPLSFGGAQYAQSVCGAGMANPEDKPIITRTQNIPKILFSPTDQRQDKGVSRVVKIIPLFWDRNGD